MISMICAVEVVAKVCEAQLEKERKEEARRKELERLRASMETRTIHFCETTIEKELIEAAKKGYNGVTIMLSEYHWMYTPFKDAVYPLLLDKITYANGDKSYSPDGKNPLSLKILVNYLRQHCFCVTVSNTTYKRYGAGYQGAFNIRIEASKELPCV